MAWDLPAVKRYLLFAKSGSPVGEPVGGQTRRGEEACALLQGRRLGLSSSGPLGWGWGEEAKG